MTDWQKKIRPGDKLKGIPAGFYNAVVDLTDPSHGPPGDKSIDGYAPVIWAKWKNHTDRTALPGHAVRLGDPELVVDSSEVEERERQALRLRHQVVFGESDDPTSGGVDDYDPVDIGGNTEARLAESQRYCNWGFALDRIAPGKVGRVAISGLFYVFIEVRHPSFHFVGQSRSSEGVGRACTCWSGPGNGEIMWLSEENHQLTQVGGSTGPSVATRMAIVRLGAAGGSAIPCFTDTEIAAMDISDPTNPEPGHGTVLPMRYGYPLSSPRQRGDQALNAYSSNWNTDADLYHGVAVISHHEVPIPAGVYTTIDWCADSRVFVVRPPQLELEAFVVPSTPNGSGIFTAYTDDSVLIPLGLTRDAYNDPELTAERPIRVSVEASVYLEYSSGTAPFEAYFFVTKDTGSGHATADIAYCPIVAAGIRHQLTLSTQLDLAADDKIQFGIGSAAGTVVSFSYARMKMRRVLRA